MHDLGSAVELTARLPAVTQGSTRGLTAEGSFVEKEKMPIAPDAASDQGEAIPITPRDPSHRHPVAPPLMAVCLHPTPSLGQSEPPLFILTKEGSLGLPNPGHSSLSRQTTNVPAQGR
jgi:hypothetical protein